MKLLSKTTLMILLTIVSVFGYVVSCTHDDIVPPKEYVPAGAPDSVDTRGNAVLLPGDMTKGDTAEWKLDKVHSSVLWSTAYVGAAGLLTGRFNQFGITAVAPDSMKKYTTTGQPQKDSDWAFYESDPTKTFLTGYVQINQSNTGEPGRDAGCNVRGMSTVAIETGVQNLKPVNIAIIKSTKIELDPYSNDYLVTLDLTWHSYWDTLPGGQINPDLPPSSQKTLRGIVGKLKYFPVATITPTTGTPYKVFGLQLKFQFDCREFDIQSTSIADVIDIECNMNFNNK
jgi:hypothetical protein